MDPNLIPVVASLPTLPGRMDSTMDQFRDLLQVAEKLGMYEAAAKLNEMIRRHDEQQEKKQ